MNTPVKLGGFFVALAAMLALAVGVGHAVGPLGSVTNKHEHGGEMASEDSSGEHGGHSDAATAVDLKPGGLMISEHGFSLVLTETTLNAGAGRPVRFRVLDSDGNSLTDYKTTHDRELHFIAVRRDLTGFQHVHPTRTKSGEWRTRLDLDAGAWRFFADFQPSEHDKAMTLGADAMVNGSFDAAPLPTPNRKAAAGAYTIDLDGELVPGAPSKLKLSVSRNGKPVADLQPYLAAYGHLVALRSGDLAYLHVHPEGSPGDGKTDPGPDITFYATAPSAGDYRLFLDFKHDGVVRTAEFTVRASRQPGNAVIPGT